MRESVDKGPYKIPLFDLDIGKEERKAVEEVLRSKWLTMGDITHRFETAFAEYLGCLYCLAVCNGTAALHLAVSALGIGPGDEVICPSMTFVATANAILYSGAIPIFADIQGKNSLNISPSCIEDRISERTKAIMVVHYGGYPCNMEAIMALAGKYNLKVIEDAAHAPGAEFLQRKTDGEISSRQKVGLFGDIGCFSFFSNKNLSMGEGGVVVTRDSKVEEKIKSLRSHGMTTLTLDRHRGHCHSYDVIDLGYNYRIDEMRAALGLVQLKKLHQKNERRRMLNAFYQEKLGKIEGIEIPFKGDSNTSAHHIFPILLNEKINRMTFMNMLKDRGIQTSIHYPPIHRFSYYRRRFGECKSDLTYTDYVGDHEVTLPLYPSLTEEDIDYIVSCLQDALVKSEF
jgi:dTDP-4-amino-4,6-dideoxygalactose transaminase